MMVHIPTPTALAASPSKAGTRPNTSLKNVLGSVRQMTDQVGAITLAQSYNPFGVVSNTNGASHTDYGFTGEQYDAYIKLIKLGVMIISHKPTKGDCHAPQPHPISRLADLPVSEFECQETLS